MDDLLQQGIVAYKAGKRDEARKIFITVVKQSPDSERAWGWMYDISGNDSERIYCLKQMLRINSKNEKATQLLNQLLAPPLTATPSITRTSSPTPVSSSLKLGNSTIQYMLGGLAIFLFVVIGGVIGFMMFSNTESTNVPSLASTAAVQPKTAADEYYEKSYFAMENYNNALKNTGNLMENAQTDANSNFTVDWTTKFFYSLDVLNATAVQISRLPPPPEKYAEMDYWLRKIAEETPSMVSNYRQAIQNYDFDALDRAKNSVGNISFYIQNATAALPAE